MLKERPGFLQKETMGTKGGGFGKKMGGKKIESGTHPAAAEM